MQNPECRGKAEKKSKLCCSMQNNTNYLEFSYSGMSNTSRGEKVHPFHLGSLIHTYCPPPVHWPKPQFIQDFQYRGMTTEGRAVKNTKLPTSSF